MVEGAPLSQSDTRNEVLAQAQLPLATPAQRTFYLLVFVLGLIVTIASLVIAFLRWNFAYSRFGPAVVWNWAAPALIIALISSLIASLTLLVWSIRRRYIAHIHPGGVTLQLGRRRRHYAWESIKDLTLSAVRYGFAGLQLGPYASATLTTDQGKRLRFRGAFTSLDNFTQAIKRHLYPLRLEAYRNALERKETISFGPIRCSPEGLQYRREIHAWKSIASASLQEGRLTLVIQDKDRLKKLRIDAGRIPNPDLCAQIIQNIES